MEECGAVRSDLLHLVWLDSDACLSENLLVEVEIHWESAYVGETERLSLGCTSNYVSKIADVSGKRDIVKTSASNAAGDGHSSTLISGAFSCSWGLAWRGRSFYGWQLGAFGSSLGAGISFHSSAEA